MNILIISDENPCKTKVGDLFGERHEVMGGSSLVTAGSLIATISYKAGSNKGIESRHWNVIAMSAAARKKIGDELFEKDWKPKCIMMSDCFYVSDCEFTDKI